MIGDDEPGAPKEGPAEKVKTIHPALDLSAQQWQVLKVTDSVDYSPGAFLEKTQVQMLCGGLVLAGV